MNIRTSGPRSPIVLTHQYDAKRVDIPRSDSNNSDSLLVELARGDTFEIVEDTSDNGDNLDSDPINMDFNEDAISSDSEVEPVSLFSVSVMGLEHLLTLETEELTQKLNVIGTSKYHIEHMVKNLLNMNDYFEVLLEIINLDDLLSTGIISAEMVSEWLLEAIRLNCFYVVRHLSALDITFSRDKILEVLEANDSNPVQQAITHHLRAYQLI